MKTDELRERYLEYFESHGHVRCASDVLVPSWDPSVLFTPAGMNQFKDHFLGKIKLDFTRATSCQKCLRAGDIDSVGRTAYHHTFFEMLGNFSFGDYFKREAIEWAWEFLTAKKWLALDAQRLSVSVYIDDDEAAAIWEKNIGLSPGKIERMGEDDNFWPAGAPSQGPDGICGPCSEIFYHRDDGSSVEIWNLVFTQFNRVGTPPENLRPLPSKNIDTGMGLERAAAILQGVESNFQIDNIRPIVEAAAEICGVRYEAQSEFGRRIRRIADHVRACTFAVHENVYPGPNKEKYVIRRLLRRAVLDGHQMEIRQPFLYQLIPTVVDVMKSAYPELSETNDRVAQVVKQEEESFLDTIDAGLERIERIVHDTKEDGRVMISGENIFFMYDTHGFPPELFEQIAAERSLTFDWAGFQQQVKQRKKDEVVDVFARTGPLDALKRTIDGTEFLGYETDQADATLLGIIANGRLCETWDGNGDEQPVTVVLDRTPFYGEAGGQVGDTGVLTSADSSSPFLFHVTDTQRDGQLTLHIGHLQQGTMAQGGPVTAAVDTARREGIRRAHSATHLLHHALRTHVGGHAQQQGSKVDDDWLRFDFTNLEPLGNDRLGAVEAAVQNHVEQDAPIAWHVQSLAEARQAGAMMLFGEKYPERVRVVSIGDYSKELCGGTHLQHTGQVGAFDILSEEGIAAGIRRITAVTGSKAAEHTQATRATLVQSARLLGAEPLDVPQAAKRLAQSVRDLRKQLAGGGQPPDTAPVKPAKVTPVEKAAYPQIKAALQEAARALNVAPLDLPTRITALVAEADQLRSRLDERQGSGLPTADQLLADATAIGEARAVVAEVPQAAPAAMRQLVDQLRKHAAPVAILLASREADDKVTLIAGVSRDLVESGADAGRWIRQVAQHVGGGGGGRPDLAQAGGKDPAKLPEALDAARKAIAEMLG